MTGRILTCGVVVCLALAPAAGGCPVCDSATGREVRSAIARDNAALNLAAVALPFIVMAGVAAAVHLGPPARRPPHGRDRSP